MTVVLGDVVNPYRSGQSDPPLHLVCFVAKPASSSPPIPGGGALEVSLLPGGQRPQGPDGIGRWGVGDDAWRGQKERSTES